jgi:pimeloyl-ACP methyl ester carboxylesterase
VALLLAGAALLPGCLNPIAAERTGASRAYALSQRSALTGRWLSAESRSVLHRYDLLEKYEDDPFAVLAPLHEKARTDERRDVRFALSEVCYALGDRRRVGWPGEPRDCFLASAVYAWWYLFGAGPEQLPGIFDHRAHLACDFYNWGLTRGLAADDDDGERLDVRLESGLRPLALGALSVRLDLREFPWPLDQFVEFLPADLYRVRGLSVRNRSSGLGAPLIAVEQSRKGMPFHRRVPATAFLRVEGRVQDLGRAPVRATLELYSGFDRKVLDVAGCPVPLQTDLTAPVAHALNQNVIWKLGSSQFFSSTELVKSGVYPMQPFRRERIPVVFVHGTFSSPIWWAEMWNTLAADPVLSRHFQCWYFVYNSGGPVGASARRLRESLTETRQRLDPAGSDPALARMVVIGHSQGGLLTKLTATDSGDRLWRVLCDKSLEEFEPDPKVREELRGATCFEHLPFVKRVVFLSTPHRGSFLAKSWINRLAARFMTISKDALKVSAGLLRHRERLRLPPGLADGMPTSLYSMSPDNALLLELAGMPLAPGIQGHSIIAVQGDGDPQLLDDGVVEYRSAHLEGLESEFVVRSGHSCQGHPLVIEEVRRILLEHLAGVDGEPPPGK